MGYSDLLPSPSLPNHVGNGAEVANVSDAFELQRRAVLRKLARRSKVLAMLGAIAGAMLGMLALDLSVKQLGFAIAMGMLAGAMLLPVCCMVIRAVQWFLWLLACSLQLGLLACCGFIAWHYLMPG